MTKREDKKWAMIQDALLADSSGRTPKFFASRRTLFGIPSSLDQEMQKLDAAGGLETNAKNPASTKPGITLVRHNIDPVYDDHSKVLILGTMPSPKSRETGFYYNHPQNRFWKVMAALFKMDAPTSNEEKRQLALSHHIALWDVLAECSIKGASDATIADCAPNDIAWLLNEAPIEHIFCTGAKAYDLYQKHCESSCKIPAIKLPSTSAANATYSLDDLIREYSVILEYL